MNGNLKHRLSRKRRLKKFREGDEVLVNFPNEYKYFGIIVDVESDDELCLVRYGDRTEKWSSFSDVKKLFTLEQLINEEESSIETDTYHEDEVKPKVNGLLMRSRKSNSKHSPQDSPSSLHTPPVTPSDIFVPEYVQEARASLPYNFDSLKWDENHLKNDQESYCYCGEDGFWYKRMYQCNQCLQWFHQACTGLFLGPDMMHGDRFYDFVCALCSPTHKETIRRLHMGIADALHVVIFNLTVRNMNKFHNLNEEIVKHFKSARKALEGPNRRVSFSEYCNSKRLLEVLQSHRDRFVCGTKNRSTSKYWGINFKIPTYPPSVGNISRPRLSIHPAFTFRIGPTMRQLARLGTYEWMFKSDLEGSSVSLKKYSELKTANELIPNPVSFSETGFNPFKAPLKTPRQSTVGRPPLKPEKPLQNSRICAVRTTPDGRKQYLLQYS